MRVYLLEEFVHNNGRIYPAGMEIDCTKPLAEQLSKEGIGLIMNRIPARTGVYNYEEIEIDISTLEKKDLKALLDQHDIKYSSRASRADLIALLHEAK